jgi:hypothetical protein
LLSMTNDSTSDMNPAKKRGIYFHASSVNVSGKALLFLGHSTAGKSTICRLLSERYPVIADDKVWACQKENGGWIVCNGDDDFQLENRNIVSAGSKKKYPLLAVVRIFKSKKMSIEPLSPPKTCRYLIDAVFEVNSQRAHKDLKKVKKWFAYAAAISKKNMGWGLTFKKDKSIIQVIHDNFEERF